LVNTQLFGAKKLKIKLYNEIPNSKTIYSLFKIFNFFETTLEFIDYNFSFIIDLA